MIFFVIVKMIFMVMAIFFTHNLMKKDYQIVTFFAYNVMTIIK